MHQWQWPAPVLLKPIEEGPLQVPVWNPKLYPSDRSHRMPIITPAYPSMCSTHNVTLSTQQIMTAEFKRAAEIVDKVFVGTAKWAELFQPHDFFSKYRYYLQITASSSNADVQLKWSGTVESRIRQLVMKLEYVDTLLLAHPFVKSFDRTNYCLNEEEQRAVSIGEVPVEVEKRTEKDLKEGEGGVVYTTTFYIGLQIERRPAGAQQGTRKLDISYPTNEFTKLVKLWDNYDAETMGVIVRYIKSSALPPYVFAGREPELPKTGGVKRAKTKKTNGTNASSAAAPAASSSATTTANAAEDSDAERLNKKHRASSFVPENATPTPAGLPPVPTQPLPIDENGTTAIPQQVRQAAEAVVGTASGADREQQQLRSVASQPEGPNEAVALPGLETSLPAAEINGLASAVTNGGPQNEAAIMAGENGTEAPLPTVSA
ncbi:hypothetical protein JCM3774_004317 [Rhodotorula dairenensis]